MTDPIRAALDAASRALCFGQNGIDCDTCMTADQCRKPGHWNTEAANTIAAFLRALPDRAVLTLLSKAPDPYYGWRDTLAEAVLAAAKEAAQ
jgi:hypothetical protein